MRGLPCNLCDTVSFMSESTPLQPPVFTLGEAAKAAKVSKPTLSKAISTGRLSAEKMPDGSYRIQAAELFRVYPPSREANRLPEGGVADQETSSNNGLLEGEVNRLREQLATLSDERDRERRQLVDQVEDLRRRLDLEGEERRKLTAILTDQRATPAEPQPAPKGLFARLFGKG